MKKWVRDDKFVQIEQGISADSGKPVVIVSSNAFKELPIKWRDQVAQSDTTAVAKRIESVSRWADSNGYRQVSQ